MKVKRIVRQEVNVSGLGARIKEARETSRYSLAHLTREAGISRTYWYQLESESVLSGVCEETLRNVEKALGINLGVQFDD